MTIKKKKRKNTFNLSFTSTSSVQMEGGNSREGFELIELCHIEIGYVKRHFSTEDNFKQTI